MDDNPYAAPATEPQASGPICDLVGGFRDGALLIVSLSPGQLPKVCLKTGVETDDTERVKYRFYNPLYAFAPWNAYSVRQYRMAAFIIVITSFFNAFARLWSRDFVVVPLPIARRLKRGKLVLYGALLALTGSGIYLTGLYGLTVIKNDPRFLRLFLSGAAVALAGGILAYIGRRRAHPFEITKVEGGRAWVSGVSPAVLARFPPRPDRWPNEKSMQRFSERRGVAIRRP